MTEYGGCARKKRRADWMRAREHYESGANTAAGIAADLGVTEKTVRRRAAREGWLNRQKLPRSMRAGNSEELAHLIDQLFSNFEAQLDQFHDGAARNQTAITKHRDDEKNARTLALLAKTLGTLLSLRNAFDGGAGRSDDNAMRRQLESRLERLCASAASAEISGKS